MRNRFAAMHIRPADSGTSTSGTAHLSEEAVNRKPRLGAPTRVLQPPNRKKSTESPLRSFVSAIGQSLGTRTPARIQHAVGASSSKSSSSLNPSADKSDPFSFALTPAEARGNASASSGRLNTNLSSTPRLTGTATNTSKLSSVATKVPLSSELSKGSGAPSSSREIAISNPSRISIASTSRLPATPPWRSSLSNSTVSNSIADSTSNPGKKQVVVSTPSTGKKSALKQPGWSTAATQKCNILARTPRVQSLPTTPPTKGSCISLRTPRMLTNSTTPGPARRLSSSTTPGPKAKGTFTPGPTRSKSFFPTTPVSKPTVANPSTPGNENFSTPLNKHVSTPGSFFTPRSSLPPSPLQPRNHNAMESSRQLHFGNNGVATEDQENAGSKTPKPYSPLFTEATFSFDKQRLAQINARRNTPQSLKSPAARVRAGDLFPSSRTPGKSLQQLAEERSARFDQSQVPSFAQSPAKKRVANSLF